MSAVYAKGTSVPVERSKIEIDTLLGKHGAGQRGLIYDEAAGIAQVVFVLHGRKYRIEVPMPLLREPERTERPSGWGYWPEDRRRDWTRKRWEQACRERWRGLVLLVKAKMEIVRMGISTFEREFLADLVLPSGETAHQTIGAYMEKLITEGYSAPLALPEAKP